MDKGLLKERIDEMTILEMSELMEKGELTSLELVKVYLQRIAEYDKTGPKLNSVLEINPDALFIAEALDLERKHRGSRGILHGIPILVKDNINTGDKMHTSAGSLALADLYAPNDAFVVKKLREAGAVILGKANMTEFANFMAENMPSGYSSKGGQVINPYDKEKTPSGSSSGSAVSAAANLCAAAVGTETDGSILSPSRENCIVGLKPTVGLVSREGIVPISHSQDTAGPMARTVTDAAILLQAMAGVDEKDAATLKSRWYENKDYTAFLKDSNIGGLRIGISPAHYDRFTEEEEAVLQEAVDVLKGKGAEIVYIEDTYEKIPEERSSVLYHEFKNGINYYLSTVRGRTKMKNLEDIINFNKNNEEKALRFGQKVLEDSELKSGTLTEEDYIMGRLGDMESNGKNTLDRIMDDMKLDAILFLEWTSIAAIAGYPSIIVPAGFTSKGTAEGITFIGRPFSEETLLRLAYVYEQATKRRKAPKLDI
ncbi:MAG: amidase family protein [Bacillota bacterium]|nr:amidase family protein [Bacillota bacterium]